MKERAFAFIRSFEVRELKRGSRRWNVSLRNVKGHSSAEGPRNLSEINVRRLPPLGGLNGNLIRLPRLNVFSWFGRPLMHNGGLPFWSNGGRMLFGSRDGWLANTFVKSAGSCFEMASKRVGGR
ncbi:MAG: hypothetical protein ACTS7I_01625 [Candidatus Hodgkinia cicadicola]